MSSRLMRRNCRNVEPADTIVVLQADLNRLVQFVKAVAESHNPFQAEAQAILELDDQLSEWQKGLYQQ